MKINKIQLFKIVAVILYPLFFLLMQELFANIENSPNTMMTLDVNFLSVISVEACADTIFPMVRVGGAAGFS